MKPYSEEKRVWSDTKGKAKDLDFSEGAPPEGGEEVQKVDISAPSRVDVEEEESESEDEGDESEEEEEGAAAAGAAAEGGLVKKKKKKNPKGRWLSAVLANSLVGSAGHTLIDPAYTCTHTLSASIPAKLESKKA